MSKLLIDDYPLQVLPKLAVAIGLNEAIVLQQLHYWLQRSNNVKKGYKWIYNSYEEWREQFPFWSIRTIKRTFTSLRNQDVIIVDSFNKAGFDKTNWYRINYDKLVALSLGQNGTIVGSKWHDGRGQNDPTNTRDYQRPLQETTDTLSGKPDDTHSADYKSIVGYLNQRAGTAYKPTSKKTQALIRARMNEGFKVDDFKKAIDTKVDDWLNDQNMNKYLRPETLFSPKFEGYLNESKLKPRKEETEDGASW